MYLRRSRAKDRIAHLVGCNGRAVLRAEEKPPKAKNDASQNTGQLGDELHLLWLDVLVGLDDHERVAAALVAVDAHIRHVHAQLVQNARHRGNGAELVLIGIYS